MYSHKNKRKPAFPTAAELQSPYGPSMRDHHSALNLARTYRSLAPPVTLAGVLASTMQNP